MKKWLYSITVLTIGLSISFFVSKYFEALLTVKKTMNTASSNFALLEFIWGYIILGFVIGGVIFQIPHHKKNEQLLKLAGSFCVFASAMLMASLGFAVSSLPYITWLQYTFSQVAITALYLGIAIVLIEMVREVGRLLFFGVFG